jgi:hypothetical protein
MSLMLRLNKLIRDLNDGNWRGVCAITAEIVANYAHAHYADASGLTLRCKHGLLHTNSIMLNRYAVINKIYITAAQDLTILMGVCGQKPKTPVDKS